MFVAEITVRLAPEADPDKVYDLLGSLRQNGQILGRELPIYQDKRKLTVVVLLPEADALHKLHDNKWVKQSRAALIKNGLTRLSVKICGEDPTSAGEGECNSPDEYILFTNYLTVESPLRCGECFNPVALYHVPPSYDDSEFYNVRTWEANYQACDTLQMNCSTGEQFGIREMSEVNSSLSRRGRDLCAAIERGTGRPVYYYLFRYVKRTTVEKEEARRCPLCGGEWLLKEPWHIFNFKCQTCRLVSTFSPTIC